MPAKYHHVHLNRSQRDCLKALITSGTSPARKLTRARVLLKADTGALGPAYTDKQIKEGPLTFHCEPLRELVKPLRLKVLMLL